MILYFDGCSHTDGHCFQINDTVHENSWQHLVSKSLLGEYFTLKIKNKNILDYLKIFRENENVIIDTSYSGKSNPSIVYNTINYISQLQQHNIKIDYSFIQLTGPSRNVIFDYDGIKDVTPHDNVKIGIRFNPFASIKTLQEIYFLQLFFKKYSIEDIYIPYFPIEVVNYINIDHTKFSKNISEGYIDFFKKMGYTCDEQGHPNKVANEIITKDVLKLLSPKKII